MLTKCGPSLEPSSKKLDSKVGRFLARPMARKRPTFLGQVSEIFKDSFLGGDSGLGRSGHFLDNCLAKRRPSFGSTFSNFQFNLFETDSELWPHLAHKSWPPFWRENGLWGEVSGLVVTDLNCDLRRRLKGAWRVLLGTS